MIRLVAGIVLAVVLAIGIFVMVLEMGSFDIPLAELEAKYKTDQSQFADIDGMRVHYYDQGPKDAPALVMLHASYMHLRTFDVIAKPLSEKYRVVRFDFPTAGLTGHDPKERYSIELNIMVLDELTKKLGIEKFAMLGTSSGGPVAFRFAADHPDRVTRMILINAAGMPRTAVTNPYRPRGTAIGRWFI
ncbi:MAG: alpha/beta hydrolase [Alphaproteobacteria bacterium]|nr:alpha/beta hydrolase [Alphaproteobacteria bacterium]